MKASLSTPTVTTSRLWPARPNGGLTRNAAPYDISISGIAAPASSCSGESTSSGSAYRSVFAYRRALARGGTYRCVGGTARSLLRLVSVGAVVGRLTGRSLGVLVVKQGPSHFEPLADLCVSQQIRIEIDRVVALEEVPDALAHVGEGRALGKVVVAPA